MAATLFIAEGIGPDGPVEVEVRAMSAEVALLRGRSALRDAHGKVRKVTIRYAAGTERYGAEDFADPNRDAGDGD